RLDDERRESVTRLANDRVTRHDAALHSWKAEEGERDRKVLDLKAQRNELAAASTKTRTECEARMNPWMTRTAAGFLVWAGYTVIGTTGMAVASMMKDHHGVSLLSDVAASVVLFMNNVRGGFVPPLLSALAI